MIRQFRDFMLRCYMRTPEHPMKHRVVRALGRYVCPEEGIWSKVYPNLFLRLHPHDWVEYLLLRGQAYEPITLRFLEANLRSGDAAILAGVNFGLHVVVAARAVGDGGKVIGIEPQPDSQVRTRTHLEANGLLERFILIPGGLGQEAGLVPMAWCARRSTGTASLFDQGTGLLVPIVTLQQVVRAAGIATVRIALVDVEGYEPLVLEGLGNTCRPDILVVECEPKLLIRGGKTSRELLQLITGMGYSLHNLIGASATPETSEFPENNVIAVRAGVNVAWPTLKA